MAEQKNRTKMNSKRLWRMFLLLFAIFLGLSLLGDLAGMVIQKMGGISFDTTRWSSVGIIGGADGPTAIFVTAAAAPVWQSLLKLLLLAAAVLVRYCLREGI